MWNFQMWNFSNEFEYLSTLWLFLIKNRRNVQDIEKKLDYIF